jgi:Na+-driven multidrug efflux pump
MVGHYVGFTGNAAIGVGWQIFLVVVVFISSLFTGMGVLVARFAGANEPDKVNRVVYQAFLTSMVLASLFRFGLPAGVQGRGHERGGRAAASVHGLAAV